MVDTLSPVAAGRVLRRVELLRDDFATPDAGAFAAAAGRRILLIRRRAKRIVFELDGGVRFFAHLGMTGRFAVATAGDELLPHTHVRFDLGDVELRQIDPRRFGGLHWLGTDTGEDNLGPEPLAIRAAELARRLAGTRRAVKAALLDQTLIAGLGNIYVDEALHGAGLHPTVLCCDIDRPAVGRLSRSIKTTLRRAIDAGGSSIRDYVDAEGKGGSFQTMHKVYGREGQRCRKCRATIERIVLGQRSTHFCPRCQAL